MRVLEGKNIVLGVSGGIACYKAVDLVSRLKKEGANVDVIMTKGAMEFVTPLTFQTLAQSRVVTDLFETVTHFDVEHISLAKKADFYVVAPATYNVVGKFAAGIADDMLTTVFAASKPEKVIVVPAMNTNMYENPIFKANVQKLEELGVRFMAAAEGRLACGDVGSGKFPEPADIIEYLKYQAAPKDLAGKHVLVTAGPTREALDPVRFISNHSTGTMGYEIAKALYLRGAKVTLVSGPVSIAKPKGVDVISVMSARDMKEACLSVYDTVDAVVMSAAVGDYRAAEVAEHKLKKSDDDMGIKLTRNDDILKTLGGMKGDRVLVGFAMESRDVETYARKKLKEKNLDMIVANNVLQEGAGFGTDTNVVQLYFKDGRALSLPQMAKSDLGHILADELVGLMK